MCDHDSLPSLDEQMHNTAAGCLGLCDQIELDADAFVDAEYSPAEIDEMYAIYCRECNAERHAADRAMSRDDSLMRLYVQYQMI